MLWKNGDKVFIPDVPSAQEVKGVSGSLLTYGKCPDHPVGAVAEVVSNNTSSIMGQNTYNVRYDAYMWNYLESDLILSNRVITLEVGCTVQLVGDDGYTVMKVGDTAKVISIGTSSVRVHFVGRSFNSHQTLYAKDIKVISEEGVTIYDGQRALF